MAHAEKNQLVAGATGALALADGTVFLGRGLGAAGEAVGELCFNTAMTGHQEILSDPSYADQIVCFTFPHVGNVGANQADGQASSPAACVAARGAVMRADVTAPSSWRAEIPFTEWLARRGIVALAGVDTRAITRRIREHGMPHAVIAHAPDGVFDFDAMIARAAAWPGIEGADLASRLTAEARYDVEEGPWTWPAGLGAPEDADARADLHVVLVDYGVKRDIARCLRGVGARVTAVPARTSAQDILALRPDGVVLSNGPGDPAATAAWAAPDIRALAESGAPLLGICLGHQILALALGGRTVKMAQGHHGANHPVKDLATGEVEIVSMNHGFAVDGQSLPAGVVETHVSLFDGTNCGLAVEGRPVFSVQHHPEASPGPRDALDIFARFAEAMRAARAGRASVDA